MNRANPSAKRKIPFYLISRLIEHSYFIRYILKFFLSTKVLVFYSIFILWQNTISLNFINKTCIVISKCDNCIHHIEKIKFFARQFFKLFFVFTHINCEIIRVYVKCPNQTVDNVIKASGNVFLNIPKHNFCPSLCFWKISRFYRLLRIIQSNWISVMQCYIIKVKTTRRNITIFHRIDINDLCKRENRQFSNSFPPQHSTSIWRDRIISASILTYIEKTSVYFLWCHPDSVVLHDYRTGISRVNRNPYRFCIRIVGILDKFRNNARRISI